MSLKAVLFDAGNTLLFLDYPRLAPEIEKVAGVPLTAEALARQAKPAAQTLERGGASDRERASHYLETLFLLAGVPPSRMESVRNRLLELHLERHLWSRLAPGTEIELHRLRSAGLRLGVISNSDGRVDEALQAAGLRGLFEVVIDSQLVGFEKPDPRIFHEALNRMGLRPAEAMYVGDIYEVDVVGARRAGLEVVLLDPLRNHERRDARTAANVAEVVELVLGGNRDKG